LQIKQLAQVLQTTTACLTCRAASVRLFLEDALNFCILVAHLCTHACQPADEEAMKLGMLTMVACAAG
jgi:hypothetical protein